jgi:energy-coupling factor transport system ATP-binding protein
MISVKGLTFSYHGQSPLFEKLSFIVPDGGLLRVSGSSGCGKTTLLYCLCGVIPRNIEGKLSGEVMIDGVPINEITRELLPRSAALVFQQPESRMFLPEAEDELAFTPENLCIPRDDIRECVERVLELTGLSGKRFEAPSRLSGGQVKLLALAGALVVPPRVLLLDELIAGLDASAAELALDCIGMLRAQGCAVVASDHNAGVWADAEILELKS